MSKNYTVTRSDARRMLSGYDDKSARRILHDAGVREKVDVIMSIIKTIKIHIDQLGDNMNDDPIPEIDLSRLPKPKAKDSFYTGYYLRKVMGDVNKLIIKLSYDITKSDNPGNFTYSYIYSETVDDGRKIRLCWEERPKQVDDTTPVPPRRRVIVLGRLLKTLFSTDLMRGARSMARELGADLDDRRTWTDAEMINKINDLTVHDSRETDAIVFYFVQRTREIATIAVGLDGYTIIHAGLDDIKSISIDYKKSAQKLAEHLLLRCEPNETTPRSKVVLLQFVGLEESHPLRVREGVYHYFFTKSGRFQVETLDLEYDFKHDSTNAKGFEQIDTCIENDHAHEIVAILGRSHRITLEVIKLVQEKHKRGPQSDFPIRVFGENITTDLLDSLNDETDPLEAICSADPYYMGRYIVRAALTELESRTHKSRIDYPPVPPVLITKDIVLSNGTLFTIDRLPDVLTSEDVRLDHEQFAWPAWMRGRCPSSYGPLFYDASRKSHPGK
jgi:DNA-binding LacI/PurR family transcriptional regulator